MTRCEHCGQSLLAYAHMRMQRDELLAAATKVVQAWWYKNAILTDVMRDLDKVIAKVREESNES